MSDAGESDTPNEQDQPSWYRDGLHFACTKCGHCCTGTTGYVWTSGAEIERLAAALSLSVDEFGRRYLRRIGTRYALLENPATGDCALLSDGLCSVHDARPEQCRTFPFWRGNLVSSEAWRAAAEDCEGIALDPDPAADREHFTYARIKALLMRRSVS